MRAEKFQRGRRNLRSHCFRAAVFLICILTLIWVQTFFQDYGKVKILFVSTHAGGWTFLKDITPAFESDDRYKVSKVSSWCDGADKRRIYNIARNADIVWVEWCDGCAFYLSRTLPRSVKLIYRMHRYEMMLPNFPKIDWNHVDSLVFIANHVQDQALMHIPPKERPQIHMIPNFVGSSRYSVSHLKRGKVLGMLGWASWNKNPLLAADILRHLLDIESGWKLVLAGPVNGITGGGSQKCANIFAMELLDRALQKLPLASYEIRSEMVDPIDFAEEIDYILSPSFVEGSHEAVRQAAMKGATPIIWNRRRGHNSLKYKNAIYFATAKDAARRIFNHHKSRAVEMPSTKQELQIFRKRLSDDRLIKSYKQLVYKTFTSERKQNSALRPAFSKPQEKVLLLFLDSKEVLFEICDLTDYKIHIVVVEYS